MNSRFIDIYRVFQRHPEGTQPKFVLRALNADRMEWAYPGSVDG